MPLATISADLDAEQLPEVSAYAATRHIAVRTQEEEEGPPAFGIAVVTFLIPIIGVIVGIVWLCRREESYRGWGGMLVFVGLLLTIVYGVIIANL